MPSCPKCQTHSLTATLLAPGLPARECGSCRGVLIDLLAYRAWAEQNGGDSGAGEDRATPAGIDDTSRAIACPRCAGLMTKYRPSALSDNRLDYCAHCDTAWLDGGEWAELADLGLRRSLGRIFTEPWQRRLHEGTVRQSRQRRLRERLGDDYAQIAQFRAWALEHPRYADILAWIADRDAD
jgi:Zn-finger nucleic acid-binding protein